MTHLSLHTGIVARLPVFPCPVIYWGSPIDRPENRLSVRMLGLVNLAFTRFFHDVRACQRSPLPARGPAILISNHTSSLDPLLIQSCCDRLITWMMAKEYYDVKGLGWVFRTIEAIPVQRSGRDMAATRAALRSLEQGRILGVFPEGKIETTRQLLPFHTGVALMAIRSQAPVYPVYLDGTQRGKEMVEALTRPTHSTIRFGPAVDFDRDSTSRETLEQATQRMSLAVKNLALRRSHCI